MWHAQRSEHRRKLAVGAERQHMYSARAHLRALECLGGEAPAGMRQPLHDGDMLPAPQKLRGAEQAAQPRADYHYIKGIAVGHALKPSCCATDVTYASSSSMRASNPSMVARSVASGSEAGRASSASAISPERAASVVT